MANQIVRHVVTGKRAEVERDERGLLWILSEGVRERWEPEDGDWVPVGQMVEVSEVQIAEVVFAADVELRKILGIREQETHWLNLRPERKAMWIHRTLPTDDGTPRLKQANVLREFLESMRVDD